MHPTIAQHREPIAEVCRRYGIRRLDVFGSSTTDAFDERTSDVDVAVDFDDVTSADYFDRFFAVKEELERIVGRRVDLLTWSSIRNPYFRQRVEATSENLYAA